MISTKLIFTVTILVACLLNVVMSDDDDDDYREYLQCDEDTCYQPIVKGPCLENLPRFAFNRILGRCIRFNYSGCEGNSNNFASYRECQESCESCVANLACSEPADYGTCYGYFPRYWYNSSKKRCEKFIYGGCGGNSNNFKTKWECQSQCQV